MSGKHDKCIQQLICMERSTFETCCTEAHVCLDDQCVTVQAVPKYTLL
jgi:hypothetical protein